MNSGMRARVVFAFLLFALGLLASPVRAAYYILYARTVELETNWLREPQAIGNPAGKSCAESSNQYAYEETYGASLNATDFDPFVLPANERILAVGVNVHCRVGRGAQNAYFKLYVDCPLYPPDTRYCDRFDQNDEGCDWRSWNDSDNLILWGVQNWTADAVNQIGVRCRSLNSDFQFGHLRVNGFRVVVLTEEVGACCFGDGLCQLLTEEQCDEITWGEWYEGETCSPCPCDVACNVSTEALDFGEVAVGQHRDLSFVIGNPGCAVLSGYVSENSDDFSIVSGGGAFSLQQFGLRTVVVRYAPLDDDWHYCDVTLGTYDCPDVSCEGTGYYASGACCLEDGSCQVLTEEQCDAIAWAMWFGGATCSPCPCEATCEVTPLELDYGQVAVGQHRDLSFVIRNPGCAVLSGNVAESSDHFTLASGGGAFSLQQNGQRTVVVRYAPLDDDIHFCDVTLGTDACDVVTCEGEGYYMGACCLEGGTCQVLAEEPCLDLLGDWFQGVTCSPWPCEVLCELSEEFLDFGEVPVSMADTLTFVVRHPGGGILTGNVTEACPAFTVVSGAGPFSLDPGDSLVVAVAFAPQVPGEFYECQIAIGTECDSLACYGEGGEFSGVADLAGYRTGKNVLRFQNPFPANAEIWFGTHAQGVAEIGICDVSGRRVRTVHTGSLAPGIYSYRWDGRDDGGRPVASGVYHVMSLHGGTRQHRYLVYVR